jgi:uncharacterized heparinase superfamily protein
MGLNRWREIGQKLTRMDRAELRDRLRQEFAKRRDSALGRVGYDFAGNSQTLTNVTSGKFFFAGDSVSQILELLCQRFPGYAERTVQLADQICSHRFNLLGYAGLDYGSPIDWHLDAVHGKRAPREAFYKVRYLDFAEVGDSKVTWELNRHQHLITLAKACRLTNDRRYADEILRQWRHWQEENPYPVGTNWASSLEAAFRSLAWLWTYHVLEGFSGVPDFRQEWLRGLAIHGRHMERYLSTYFSPNTHLLGEGVGLFFLGVLCPELAAAERWKSLGWKIVLNQAERQVLADGMHFEQSTYYHVYALDFFLHASLLASVNNIAIPKSFEETLQKMLTALCLLGRGGPPPRFGDDDGGRLFDPSRNRSEHLLDPLATGAILFQRGDYKSTARGLREETVWLLGAEGVKVWDELEESEVPKESSALPDTGFYLLAAEKSQLVVDAGPQGIQNGGHGHADALSVCLKSNGSSLLIDPGTYEYVGPSGDRDVFRGTAMHNTLRVDGVDQAEAATPFSWRRLTRSKTEQWIQGKSFDLLVASHDGYQRLEPPVTHQRWVVSLRNGLYLVRDVVRNFVRDGKGRHRVEVAWHLGPDLQLVREHTYRMKNATNGLSLLPCLTEGWSQEVRRESWSPAYGQKSPMTTVNFSAVRALPAEFAVLLVTWDEIGPELGTNAPSFACVGSERGESKRGHDEREQEINAYRYVQGGGEYLFAFSSGGKPWRIDSMTSDAEFVCRKRGPGGTDRVILCGGSYARVDGGPELRCPRPVQWAELTLNGTAQAIFSSDVIADTSADVTASASAMEGQSVSVSSPESPDSSSDVSRNAVSSNTDS